MIIFGLTALSFYLIYKNKNNIAFNLLEIYTNIDNNLSKYLYNNHKIIKCYENNEFRQITDYDKNDDSTLFISYFIDNKYLNQIVNSNNNDLTLDLDSENENTKKYLNYISNIISCSIKILDDKDNIMYDDYNITDFINLFILYNSNLILTNKHSNYKSCFFSLLNDYLNLRNVNISENDKVIWKIILDDISIYEGEEFIIYVKEGKLKINNT